jgi:hypothetical protein
MRRPWHLVCCANALDAGWSASRAQQQRLIVVSRRPAEAGHVRTALGLGHSQQRRRRRDAHDRQQRGDDDDDDDDDS